MKLYESKYWIRESCPGWTNGSQALSNSLARTCLYILAITIALVPVAAFAQVRSCNGAIELNYPIGNNFAIPGDVYRIDVHLGAGTIAGGDTLTVNRLRFELDCTNPTLGIPCTDEGALVSYSGNLDTTDCAAGGVFSDVVIGNEVTFTPTTPVAIPEATLPQDGCHIEFDITIDSTATSPGGNTPNAIDQVVGYNQAERDGECNNVLGPLAAGTQQSAAIPVCPACDGDTFCQSDTCNQVTGQCETQNENEGVDCADFPNSDQCIPDVCLSGLCVEDGDTANTVLCENDTFCLSDSCDPANGQCVTQNENEGVNCADFPNSDQCIPDVCLSGVCAEDGDPGNVVVCDDEVCESCDPATGVCEADDPIPDMCLPMEPVPTLSAGGLVAMILTLLGLGGIVLRRRLLR